MEAGLWHGRRITSLLLLKSFLLKKGEIKGRRSVSAAWRGGLWTKRDETRLRWPPREEAPMLQHSFLLFFSGGEVLLLCKQTIVEDAALTVKREPIILVLVTFFLRIVQSRRIHSYESNLYSAIFIWMEMIWPVNNKKIRNYLYILNWTAGQECDVVCLKKSCRYF